MSLWLILVVVGAELQRDPIPANDAKQEVVLKNLPYLTDFSPQLMACMMVYIYFTLPKSHNHEYLKYCLSGILESIPGLQPNVLIQLYTMPMYLAQYKRCNGILEWRLRGILSQVNYSTVMFLSFRIYRSGQTVQTQIRLLLQEQSDQGLYCLQFPLHLLDALL